MLIAPQSLARVAAANVRPITASLPGGFVDLPAPL
jgi:hypothetical protein